MCECLRACVSVVDSQPAFHLVHCWNWKLNKIHAMPPLPHFTSFPVKIRDSLRGFLFFWGILACPTTFTLLHMQHAKIPRRKTLITFASSRLVLFSQSRWHSSLASSYCLIFNLAHLNSIRFNALCGGPIWAFGHLPRLTVCVCVCECCQADWHAAAVPRIISLKFLIHLKLIKWHRLRWNKKKLEAINGAKNRNGISHVSCFR